MEWLFHHRAPEISLMTASSHDTDTQHGDQCRACRPRAIGFDGTTPTMEELVEFLVIGVAVGTIIYFWNRRKERSPNVENKKDDWMAEICPSCTCAGVFKISERRREPKTTTEKIKRREWEKLTSPQSSYMNKNSSQNIQVIIEVGIEHEVRKCNNCGFEKQTSFFVRKEI
jgi:hypothetical protein